MELNSGMDKGAANHGDSPQPHAYDLHEVG